jgi:pantetheine-phosphate adenylyltransferase
MMSASRIGVYPGTFDPITNGHIDVIVRATKVVDRLVVGVARNAGKGPLFSTEERVATVKTEIDHLPAEVRKRISVKPIAFSSFLRGS